MKIYLLGGYDLEMIEIKNLLFGLPDSIVFDNHLNWHNADLLSYINVLEEYGNKAGVSIYGIELSVKNVSFIPDNYNPIDHHNNYESKLSSLEKIADLLRIFLSREQRLIAANDKGYIPAMLKIGASQDEISNIRIRDKQAQGITDEDEQLAELSIKNKTIEQGIYIVKSTSSHFSPICDRLYPCQKLLVYTNSELVYYGERKDVLISHFSADIENGRMYHGGGKEGFIGTVKDAFSEIQILEIKNAIVQLLK